MINILKKNKGVALLWSLVICTVLLIITGTMVSYMSKENQMSINIENSSQAYAFAKTGVDWALVELENNKDFVSIGTTFNFDASATGNQKVEVIVTQSPITIKSTGYYFGVKRTLEYEVSGNAGEKITPNSTPNGTPIGDNNESFDLQFDFMAPNTRDFDFGVQGSGNKIFASLSSSSSDLLKIKTLFGVTAGSADSNAIYTDLDRNKLYNYRANIKYLKDSLVSFKLTQRVITGAVVNYNCLKTVSIDLTGKDFGNLNQLYVASGGTVSYIASGGTAGDGEYIRIANGVSDGIIIDNIIIKKVAAITAPPPPPTPTVTVSLSPSPASGVIPVSSDITITVGGTATGDISYKFDCTNDGTFESITLPISTNPYTKTCTYPTAGTFTARFSATRQGITT